MSAVATESGNARKVIESAASAAPGAIAERTQQARELAYPVDTGQVLTRLMRTYAATQKPIPVSFRDLVPWIKMGERATHHIHTYPAKLLPQIAHFFLATTTLVGAEDTVLDPFGGTGTVALETILSGREALYADANPLARLIAATKTDLVEIPALEAAFDQVKDAYTVSRARARPNVVNLERWFDEPVIARLVRLRAAIMRLGDARIRSVMQVTFSAALRKASLADPRFSVPVRRKAKEVSGQAPDVWRLFEQQYRANLQRIRNFDKLYQGANRAKLCGEDARALIDPVGGLPIPDGSVGLVLTSPPYAGAQKYVRAASLSLGWLDIAGVGELRPLEDATIGREHFPKAQHDTVIETGIAAADVLLAEIRAINPARALIAATYLIEMRSALREAVRVLRPGGHFVLVIGDNTVCGRRFATSDYLETILHDLGLTTRLALIDDIKSRGLMTRRAATASVITTEQVIVLSKDA